MTVSEALLKAPDGTARRKHSESAEHSVNLGQIGRCPAQISPFLEWCSGFVEIWKGFAAFCGAVNVMFISAFASQK